MIVYIVVEADGYDYYSIEKVFASKESAEKFAATKPFADRSNKSGDGYYVVAREVQP